MNEAVDRALDVSAKWSLYLAVEAWMEEAWEIYFPDVGEYDFDRVCERMMKLMPPDVTVDERNNAYRVLSERAAQ
jgi:hypothetical protein